MLYNIKNNRLRYWNQFDELGGREKFEFENSPCACGSRRAKLVANTTRHRNKFEIVQCRNCGTLRIDPYLTKASIEKYYEHTYGEIKRHSVPAEKLYKKQTKAGKLVFSLVEKFVSKDSRILDFGGGAGGKMNELLAQGYDVYLKEVDANYYDYGLSRGLKAFDPALKYNFIFLSRILEHMAEPVDFLREVSALLAEGGHIYVEVPLIENARDGYLLNEFHVAHKFYFTGLSLAHVLRLAGLTPVHRSRNLFIVTPVIASEAWQSTSLRAGLGGLPRSARNDVSTWWQRKNMRRMGRQVVNRAALANLWFALGFAGMDRVKN